MKKRKKLTARFAAIMAFSFILSGCSSKNAEESSTTIEITEEEETSVENKAPAEDDTSAGSNEKARIPQHLMISRKTAPKTRFLIF